MPLFGIKIIIEELCFENVFCPYVKVKLAFSNFSSSKSKKLGFRDRLVSMVGPTIEIKLHFQISLV